MDRIFTQKERILHFIENQHIKKVDFFNRTGVAYANFKGNALKSELGGDKIAKILTVYPQLSSDWLVTGNGSMLRRTDINDKIENARQSIKNTSTITLAASAGQGIPLVSEHAIAGFGNSEFAIKEQDVKDYYVIPKFKYCNIDFMIEIHGSSMYPKYNSGDVVACTIIRESKFIQWNKCHVIATREQGILVKRLKKGDSPDSLLAVSDNKDYDSFNIPINEITGIALVVGVIRLE
jgi:Predicted transcriptional regulator